MRALPRPMTDLDRRLVMRVPPQAYLHWDRNDYSLDPRFAGRRAEVRIGQTEISARTLDSGEPIGRRRRSFAKGLTSPTPPTRSSSTGCAANARRGSRAEVETRPLGR
jgi:hypothetical protein